MAEDRSLRLLVVEDEGMLILMLGDMLEELGHQVAHIASNIPDALKVIEGHADELDGCLLDANLGGWVATPIARALRRVQIPFIIVSGYERRELDRLELAGPTVTKPYSIADIQSALASLSA